MAGNDRTSFSTTPRRTVLTGFAAIDIPGFARATCAQAQVLFVCPAGTVKSAITRETLKARARAAGLQVQVRSRGVHPQDHVSRGLAANLRTDGAQAAIGAAVVGVIS